MEVITKTKELSSAFLNRWKESDNIKKLLTVISALFIFATIVLIGVYILPYVAAIMFLIFLFMPERSYMPPQQIPLNPYTARELLFSVLNENSDAEIDYDAMTDCINSTICQKLQAGFSCRKKECDLTLRNKRQGQASVYRR